ncbi:MAG TPA: response regulator [Vicinamibacterales bacterium]|jgi:CheY-like chemotaxis protein|nr:response regulator [Vicinamibacterales bacterium]
MPNTLLLADDSVTIQRVIELTFAQEDVRVVSVSDGRQAIRWMEIESPDIVLVDVEAPEVDGYGVAAHVKQSPNLRDVPVLLLAGAFEPVDEARAALVGCDGVLVKPFEPQQLVARVKALLERPAAGDADSSDAADHGDAHETDSVVTPFRAHGGRGANDALGGSSGPAAAALHARDVDADAEPEPLEPPTRPVWELGLPTPIPSPHVADVPVPAAGATSAVSLVNAFSALLAEQSNRNAAAAPAVVSEASVEDAVRRVLARMTDDLVRRLVVETAERLIREEIEKIKASPE